MHCCKKHNLSCQDTKMNITNTNQRIVLIGAGIMSATLGTILRELLPDATISIYERLDKAGSESSDAWNNAGTGHSAFCELNYTPPMEDGSIDISKALTISEQFEISKQFWAYIKESKQQYLSSSFINDIDHISLVWGQDNVDFLRKRYAAMAEHPIFEDMLYTEEPSTIAEWAPLMMKGRSTDYPIAATRMAIGTDVNFGAITRSMIRTLEDSPTVELNLAHEVEAINNRADGTWSVETKNLTSGKKTEKIADFVFIGAGGGALTLLEKSDIPEVKGFGGFPVSGQWLRCNNPEVIQQHEAKVYGKAAVGSPPMSVPHLDTRIIKGARCLLFGPYAGFSTKFLKNGSYLDLFLSIEMHNVWPMLSAGAKNLSLTKYLVEQVLQSKEDKFEFLQQYYPEAKIEDWEVAVAGQRVQIIKKDEEDGGGKLQFGTEVVTSADGSLSALLGASPGASTSVSIMLDLLGRCFPEEMKSDQWQNTIRHMIPTYGQSLIADGALLRSTRARTTHILQLEEH